MTARRLSVRGAVTRAGLPWRARRRAYAGAVAEPATLYRCRTRTNYLCPCGRVARALRHHGVAYAEVRLDRQDRTPVEDLTGQYRLPVLDIDGEAIADSKRIVEHLRWRAGE